MIYRCAGSDTREPYINSKVMGREILGDKYRTMRLQSQALRNMGKGEWKLQSAAIFRDKGVREFFYHGLMG